MSEQNKYFPNLFSPIKVGTKTIKNRIEAAPALFAFLHLVEAPAFHYYGPGPERAFRQKQQAARAASFSENSARITPTANVFHLSRTLIIPAAMMITSRS